MPPRLQGQQHALRGLEFILSQLDDRCAVLIKEEFAKGPRKSKFMSRDSEEAPLSEVTSVGPLLLGLSTRLLDRALLADSCRPQDGRNVKIYMTGELTADLTTESSGKKRVWPEEICWPTAGSTCRSSATLRRPASRPPQSLTRDRRRSDRRDKALQLG